MHRPVWMFPTSYIVILACLAALTGACAATIPSAPRQSGAAEQNAPPTPELSTIQIPAEQQAAPPGAGPATKQDCPGLDSTLGQIVASPDPLEQAKQSLVPVKDGDKIQVVLVLNQPDTSFLRAYDVEIGGQSDTRVQAYVPIGQLCDLAKTDEVLAINLPAQAVPQ